MLKCENLPSTNSTISGAQYNFSKTSTPQGACVAAGLRGRGCVIVLLDYCIVLLMLNMHGRGRAWQGACVAGGV